MDDTLPLFPQLLIGSGTQFIWYQRLASWQRPPMAQECGEGGSRASRTLVKSQWGNQNFLSALSSQAAHQGPYQPARSLPVLY